METALTRRKPPSIPPAELLRLLLENVRDYAIFVLDPEGCVTQWGEGAERIFGVSDAAMLGSHFSRLFTAEDIAQGVPEQELLTAAAEGRASDERWHVGPNDRRLWMTGVTTALRDPRGTLRGFVKVARDRTGLKQAEEERTRLLAREQEARTQAEETMRAHREIVTLLSHDLKSPLTAIKSTAQLLEAAVKSPGPPHLERVTAGLARIDRMTDQIVAQLNQLLDATQLEAGQALALERRVTDLVRVAERLASEHQERTRRHRIEVKARVPSLVGIWDTFRIERVVDNLLSNAVKYSPHGGTIILTLERDSDTRGAWAVLHVQDEGIGIPAADLPHVFEPYYRASNVGNRARGTGIGLPGACSIVKQHGGTITTESEEGAGARFTVRLPLAP